MRADAPDFVLFLGDYIYEYPNAVGAVRSPGGGWTVTLDDYRRRHALHKSDTDLQAMHAACPWFVTWDDHEVQNDYAGLTPGDGGPAVADFAAWARDLEDQRTKLDFYPNVDKSRLFELGYIAERSGHSRGSTIDITLIDLATGAEIEMGTPFDLFDTRSWPTDTTVSDAAQANRLALQRIMVAHGFRPLREEWWHFTLNNEPFPETYFDTPISQDSGARS